MATAFGDHESSGKGLGEMVIQTNLAKRVGSHQQEYSFLDLLPVIV